MDRSPLGLFSIRRISIGQVAIQVELDIARMKMYSTGIGISIDMGMDERCNALQD